MPAADRNKALGLVLAVGVACGAALQRLTILVSNSDIGGPGWTLRGNGALIVVFGGMAMLLAGGWTFLARHSWPRAILAGALALALELALTFLPIVAGADAGWLAPIASAYVLLPFITPLLVAAALIGRAWSGWLALLGGLWLVALIAGLALGGVLGG